MKPLFIFFIFIGILLFGGINYYIGLRGWQNLASLIPFFNSRVYWIIFWVIAFAFIIARLGERFLPSIVDDYFSLIGAYWMAAMMYFIIIIPILDLLKFIMARLTFIPDGFKNSIVVTSSISIVVFLLVAAMLIYGTWNAKNVQVVHYDIHINKNAGNLKKLHVMMVSDTHLGSIVDNKRLAKMVETINENNPDLVLLAGDIVDEKAAPYVNQKMADTFLKLKAKYGVYGVTGNHEYIGGEADEIVRDLEASGIKMLRDDYVKVEDSFYIVGREDTDMERFKGKKRKPISELLTNVDMKLPVLLMDHQPQKLEEARVNGIDLQLSGHTHRGQMFPNDFITRKVFELDWGYLKKGDLNVIVSLGYGTWGPPIRIGNRPEIVDITLNFKH